ncbi:hypothetical protein [Sorangium sp. So ce117]|uniref:hypothetical protein n=1 Tax=Sorangium sp. So ce117 TaxID=3133277 RepID=UPI003F62758D
MRPRADGRSAAGAQSPSPWQESGHTSGGAVSTAGTPGCGVGAARIGRKLRKVSEGWRNLPPQRGLRGPLTITDGEASHEPTQR